MWWIQLVWRIQSCGGYSRSGDYSRVGDTVVSGVYSCVVDTVESGDYSRVGVIVVSGDYSRVGVCMYWRRPEGAGWYDWTLLRSQLEEGADSEEELWVTDESDTDSEESDIGDGKDD